MTVYDYPTDDTVDSAETTLLLARVPDTVELVLIESVTCPSSACDCLSFNGSPTNSSSAIAALYDRYFPQDDDKVGYYRESNTGVIRQFNEQEILAKLKDGGWLDI